MNHSINFNVKYEILDKKKKTKEFSTKIQAHDLELSIGEKGMTLSNHKVPFKSFVRNFGLLMSKIFGSGSLGSLKYASGGATTVYTATNFLTVIEAALSASRARRGIYIGDKGANSINGASLGAITTGTSVSLWAITGNVQNSVQKGDTWLKRRLEADTTSADTGITYGTNSVVMENDTTVKITRRFYNGSGKTVKVNEIGLGGSKTTTGLAAIVLLARDTTAYDVSVLTGQYIDITYRFTVASGLTNNFIVMLANLLSGTISKYSYINTNGAPDTLTTLAKFSLNQVATQDSWGIIIGQTNEAGISSYDYKLENEYSHGATEPYFDYGATEVINNIDTSNSTTKFGFYRDFTCKGTSSKEVAEAGLALESETAKPIFIARFPINGIVCNPEDVLRVSVYFDFPVSTTTYVTEGS